MNLKELNEKFKIQRVILLEPVKQVNPVTNLVNTVYVTSKVVEDIRVYDSKLLTIDENYNIISGKKFADAIGFIELSESHDFDIEFKTTLKELKQYEP